MVLIVNVDYRSSHDPRLSQLSHKVPQFFDDSSQPYSQANAYLNCLARRLSPKSIKTIAEHIKEYLAWSERSGIKLYDVSDDIFDIYVDTLCCQRKESGKTLSWNTVNARAAGAYRYLIWCYEKGFCPGLNPVEVDTSYRGLRKKYCTKGHHAKKLNDYTKFLILETAVKFIDCLSDVSESKNSHVRLRNKLIGALMLQSGLRISEVLKFPLKDLPEVDLRGHSTPARIFGKGNKARLVLIPNNLLVKLWQYVDIDRQRVVERVQDASAFYAIDEVVFLSEKGRRLTSNWIEKLFVKASERIGVKTVPHVLRHTYGTYHYLLNRDLAGLASLMGHSSETTTRTYYVHTAILIAYSGSYSALQDEIDKLIGPVYE